jgi:integrase
LQKLYNEKFKKGRLDGEGGLSARYVRYIHNIIHGALDQALKNQLVVRNVSDATSLPRQTKQEIRVFTIEEQQKFIEAVENDRWGSAFKLDLASGLRLGELLALRWSDINFDEGVLKVRNSLSRVRITEDGKKTTQIIFQEPKTKSGLRTIPLPESIMEDLKQHKISQDNEKNFMGKAYFDDDLVFSTQYGTPIEPRNMMRKFYEINENANIPKTNFHALRHYVESQIMGSVN